MAHYIREVITLGKGICNHNVYMWLKLGSAINISCHTFIGLERFYLELGLINLHVHNGLQFIYEFLHFTCKFTNFTKL